MHVLITYKVQLEALAEHLRLVDELYADLRRLALTDLSYATHQLEDETSFVEVFATGAEAGALAASPAFAAFRSTLESRIDAAPEVTDLRLIGSYASASSPAALPVRA